MNIRLVSIFILLGINVFAFAGIKYYVNGNTGNNSNNGTSPSTAFQTINYAAGQANFGDTILVMEGIYTNPSYGVYEFFKNQSDCTIYINNKNPGANQYNYLVIKPYENDRVILRGDGLMIVHIKNSSYIKVEGFEVYGEVENIPLDSALQYQFLYLDEDDNIKYRLPPFTPIEVVEDTILPILPPGIKRPTYFNTSGMGAMNCHHIEFSSNYVHHMPGEGIRSFDSDFIIFKDNEVHDCSRRSSTGVHGMSVYTMISMGTEPDSFTIKMTQNRVHHNYNELYSWSSTKTFINPHIDEGKGITVQRCTASRDWDIGRILIENNIAYENGLSGIHANEGERVEIRNNSLYNNHYSGVGNNHGISLQSSYDIKIRNNIVTRNSTGYSISVSSNSTNIVINRNMVVGTLNSTANNIATNTSYTDPKYYNPAEYVFRLKSTSQAINFPNVNNAPPIDFYGNVRDNNPDLGAAEYITGCTTIVTSSNDSGTGTLRDKLNCAQEGDTITFAANISSCTLNNALYNTKNVFIKGPVANYVNINQNQTNPPLFPRFINKPSKTLKLQNIRFQNSGNTNESSQVINHGKMIIMGNVIVK